MAPSRFKLGYLFDVINSAAVAWAESHAGELVTDVTSTTREMIRDYITALFEGESTWDDVWTELDDIFHDEDRVMTIAHTEAMRAANEGQKELWAQAVKDGYLDGDEMMKWIVTPDDKLCPVCEAQDGMLVKLGDEFPTGGPPAHPNCRCTIGLVLPDAVIP